MLFKRIILLFFATLFFLGGCQSPALYHQSEENIADVDTRARAAEQKSNAAIHPSPSLVVNQGMYIDRTPINLAREPLWLKNHIVIRGEQLPFTYYSRTVVNGGGKNILTRYQVGLDPSTTLTMNYSGDVKGALDLISTKTGYLYSVNGNQIYWQAFVTRTFDVAFMPGASDYMMGKTGGSNASMPAGGTGSAQGILTGVIDDSASSQYSNLKGTLSIWKDLKETIQQMLTPDGRVMVSEATTSVTVRDKPSNVDLVGRYICNLNKSLSRQVLVKVQVLEVQLSSDFIYGINWQLMQKVLRGNGIIGLNANNSEPINFTPIGASTGISALNFGYNSGRSNLSTLIDALNQQGKVSVVSEPRVVALNNQVSVIRIVSQEGYLASIQNTTVAGTTSVNSGTITSQVTPGTLVTGLTLYVLPKILGDKVYLQVNGDLSNNLGFKSISSDPSGKNPNAVSIQVPNITQKQFNQRSMIASGSTLILSGFRQVQNTANASQLFGSQALGGQGALQTNNETIVLITPIILHGFN